MISNRAFVLRGSKVGAFKHNDDDELEFVGKIGDVSTLEGRSILPSKVSVMLPSTTT